MPTYLNPFKSSSRAPASLRLKWLRDIFAPFDDVEICSYEVDLAAPTPTIESVRYLQKSYENIYLVIGADNLEKLSTWHDFEALNAAVKFIVASRDAIEVPSHYLSLKIDRDISSTQLRDTLDREKFPKQSAEEIQQYYKEKNAK